MLRWQLYLLEHKMTYPAPDKLTYDEWFDPNYKYDPDNKTIVKDTVAEISLHEKLYRHAIKNGNTLTIGGSENMRV